MDDEGAGGGGRSGKKPGGPATPWRLWNLKAPEWRTAGWLGAILVAGLILLTARPAAAPKAPTTAASTTAGTPSATAADPLQAEAQSIEADLAQALDAIAGAGPVTVRVHLKEGPVTDFAANTQVTDSTSHQTSQGGGDQVTTQRSVSRQLASGATGGGTPPVQSVSAPQITGVLVVAAGAANPSVQAELAAAVQAATGVPLYEVVVLPAAAGGASGA